MFKNLLILCFLGFAVVACSTSNASSGKENNSSTITASDIYANAAIMVLENDTLNRVEVYKSFDGRVWSGPATAFLPSDPSIQNIDGKLEDYIVVDNNTMVVSTDKGIYISSDGWVSFRLSSLWERESIPTKRGIGYLMGNIMVYDGNYKFHTFEGPTWFEINNNWSGRNFIYAGVPILPK